MILLICIDFNINRKRTLREIRRHHKCLDHRSLDRTVHHRIECGGIDCAPQKFFNKIQIEIDENQFQDETLTIYFQDMDRTYLLFHYATIWIDALYELDKWHHPRRNSSSTKSPYRSLVMHLKVIQKKTRNMRGKRTLRGIRWLSTPHYIFVPHTHKATNQERTLKSPACPHKKATQSTLRARVRQAKQETECLGRIKEHNLTHRKRSRNLHCTKAMISFIWASIVGCASSFNRPSSSLRTPQRRRKSGSTFIWSKLMLSFSIASREAAMSDAISKKIYTTTTTTTKRNTNRQKHTNPCESRAQKPRSPTVLHHGSTTSIHGTRSHVHLSPPCTPFADTPGPTRQ